MAVHRVDIASCVGARPQRLAAAFEDPGTEVDEEDGGDREGNQKGIESPHNIEAYFDKYPRLRHLTAR